MQSHQSGIHDGHFRRVRGKLYDNAQPQSHLDRKAGGLLRGVSYHSACGNNLVFKDLQKRYLLYVSPCGRTAQQTLLRPVHHSDLLSGAGKLSFSLHGRMEGKCPGPAPRPDSLG